MIAKKHTILTRIFLALFVTTSLVSSLLGFAPKATAAQQGEWVSASTIKVGDKNYIDAIKDDSRDYFKNGTEGSCQDEIDDFSNGDKSAHINIRTQDTVNDKCDEKVEDIALAKAENANIYLLWVDSAKLEGVFVEENDDRDSDWMVGTYTRVGDTNEFVHNIEGNCRSSFKVGADVTKATVIYRDKRTGSCAEVKKIDIRLGADANAVKPKGTGKESIAPVAAANGSTAPSCESVNKSILIGWLICGVINAVDGTLNILADAVDKMLNIENKLWDKNGLKVSWAIFKNLATFLLIAVGLVMIISQAIGNGPFDAYTVRKILPRLLIAVVAIQLSWYLFTAMIQIVNVIGWGLQGILYAPWGGESAFTLNTLLSQSVGGNGTSSTGGFLTLAAVGGAVAGGVAFLGLAGLLLVALSVLVAILVGFFTLIFREVLIIILLVLAPLAIVAWILPNTERYWKIWWENYLKLLLLYPMVLLLIAGGRLVAKITLQADLRQPLTFIIMVVAVFTPFFLLPRMFQLAGSALASINGAINKGAAPIQKSISGARNRKIAENAHKMKTGDRFQGRNAVSRAFNRRTSGLAGGAKAGFGFGARGEAYHDLHGRAAAEEAIKNNANLRQLAFDDAGIAVMALSGGTRRGAERVAQRLVQEGILTQDQANRAVTSAATVGFNNSNATAAMTLMAQNKSRVLSGTLAGEAGMDLVRQSATQLAGGNEQMVENLMGGFAYNSRGAGRIDLGGEGAGESLLAGWGRTSVAQHAGAFTASTEAFARSFTDTIQNGSSDERRAAAIALSEMQNMLPNATAENQAVINEAMAAVGVDHNLTRTATVTVGIDPTTGNPVTEQQQVKITVEEQLANIASGFAADGSNATGPRVISAQEIAGLARQYASNVPVEQRGQQGGQQQQQPPPGGP